MQTRSSEMEPRSDWCETYTYTLTTAPPADTESKKKSIAPLLDTLSKFSVTYRKQIMHCAYKIQRSVRQFEMLIEILFTLKTSRSAPNSKNP